MALQNTNPMKIERIACGATARDGATKSAGSPDLEYCRCTDGDWMPDGRACGILAGFTRMSPEVHMPGPGGACACW